jgi:hypothetical protein
MIKHFTNYYGNSFNFSLLYGHLQDLFLGKYIFLLSPFLFFYNLFKKNHSLNLSFLVVLTIFTLYLVTNGSLRHPRYFFSCYFLLIFFLFDSFSYYAQQHHILFSKKKIFYFILLLILIDSKIDKSLKRSKMIITDMIQLNTQLIILKYIPFSHFSLHFPNWYPEKSATHHGNFEYILSDSLSDSYYLPDHIRLHTSLQTPQAAFLEKCHHPEEVHMLKRYRYAILLHDKNNLCYQKIKSSGKLLTEIRNHKLFQMF